MSSVCSRMPALTDTPSLVARGRWSITFISLSLLASLGACTGRPAGEASGQEIYLQLCANCHAEDLSGGIGPALGPGSNAAEQSDDFLEVTILRGRGSMPSFSSSLDATQLSRLIGYVREVQQQ